MRIRQTIVVERPIGAVFRALTDVTSLDGGVVDVGARVSASQAITGQLSALELEVFEYEPPHRFGERSVGDVVAQLRYALEPHGHATRVTQTADVDLGLPGLAELKHVVETWGTV